MNAITPIDTTEHTPVPVVTLNAGRPMADSRNVAAMFGKRHDNVVRDIRGLLKNEETPELRDSFFEATYTDPQNGRSYPCFQMDRTGFSILTMGFTGSKALRWRVDYNAAFEAMERELRSRQPSMTAGINVRDPSQLAIIATQLLQVTQELTVRAEAAEAEVAVKSQALAIANDTIAEQAPAVEALDRLSATGGGTCVTDTAKRLGVRPGKLFEYMRNPNARVRWLIKRSPTSEDVAYQERLDAGELVTPVEQVTVHPRGEKPRTKLVDRLYVTPTGLIRLAKLLVEAKDPLLPKPVDLVHLVRLSRGDMTSRPRGGDPGLFD